VTVVAGGGVAGPAVVADVTGAMVKFADVTFAPVDVVVGPDVVTVCGFGLSVMLDALMVAPLVTGPVVVPPDTARATIWLAWEELWQLVGLVAEKPLPAVVLVL
jgi:hypothetical protein